MPKAMRLRFADDDHRQRVCEKIDRLWDRAAPLLTRPERSKLLELASELDPRLDVEMLGGAGARDSGSMRPPRDQRAPPRRRASPRAPRPWLSCDPWRARAAAPPPPAAVSPALGPYLASSYSPPPPCLANEHPVFYPPDIR